jgi:hypothetical protein
MRFKSKIGLLKHLPGMRYLEIPPNAVKKFKGQRVHCTVNGKVRFQGGMVALGGGKAYITISQKRLEELGLEAGGSATVELTPDSSKYGAKMPAELKAVFEQDPEGEERFKSLTPGKQRYIIQYVGAVKSPDLRVERALLLITNLKRLPRGKEQFREMLGLPRKVTSL